MTLREPYLLAASLVALTALAFWLEGRFGWARRVGATLLVIVGGALVSNLGLVAVTSPVYDLVSGPLTSLAIAWLLLGVDLRHLRAAGPRMLIAFTVAVGATCVGAVVATLLLGGALPGEAWKLAGTLTGTYSGGGVNFGAVGRAVGLSSDLFAAATAADNVLTALWMIATLALPVWLAGFYPPRPAVPPGEGARAAERFFATVPLRPFDLAALVALGLLLVTAADRLASAVGLPGVLWLTTLALLVGQLPGVRDLAGGLQLGLVTLHLFFAVLGISSRFSEILRVGPVVFYFTAVVVAVHGLVTFLVARALRLDVETTAVASQAAVGGPSTALALAVSRGWPELALPGAMVGLLGYAVGNYAGLAVATAMRSLLGG